MELGTKEKMPPPSLGSGIGGVKMSSHAPLNCGCSQHCPPCEIILKRRQKDPGVKTKLEMSNCHQCSGACPVPTPLLTSDASCSCGGQLWHPADCHLQCQIHFSSLPDAHLAPKHSPAQKNRGVSNPLTTGMRVKWIQSPSSLPF